MHRRGRVTTILDHMLKHLTSTDVERYMTEFTLISILLEKIRRDEAVRTRWLPSFSPSFGEVPVLLNQPVPNINGDAFRFKGGYDFPIRTIGQWFLLLVNERIRLGNSTGIPLRTLFYATMWCLRQIKDADYEKLACGAYAIRAWLLRDTCRDCLYKHLREIRSENDFEYTFGVADTFSAQFIVPDLKVAVAFGSCDGDVSQTAPRNGLRTFGAHSFLVSPIAHTSIIVKVVVTPNSRPVPLKMTGAQIVSLQQVIDLHARVLRALEWESQQKVVDSWVAEQRIRDPELLMHVMTRIILDLFEIRALNAAMETTVAHFSVLIFDGKMSGEMKAAYVEARSRDDITAHKFMIEHSFLRAPTPDMCIYAQHKFETFMSANAVDRAKMRVW